MLKRENALLGTIIEDLQSYCMTLKRERDDCHFKLVQLESRLSEQIERNHQLEELIIDMEEKEKERERERERDKYKEKENIQVIPKVDKVLEEKCAMISKLQEQLEKQQRICDAQVRRIGQLTDSANSMRRELTFVQDEFAQFRLKTRCQGVSAAMKSLYDNDDEDNEHLTIEILQNELACEKQETLRALDRMKTAEAEEQHCRLLCLELMDYNKIKNKA